jgi:hypothetical protein
VGLAFVLSSSRSAPLFCLSLLSIDISEKPLGWNDACPAAGGLKGDRNGPLKRLYGSFVPRIPSSLSQLCCAGNLSPPGKQLMRGLFFAQRHVKLAGY